MERGQHGGQQAELDQDHQPAGPAEGGKAAAGTSAQGAGLIAVETVSNAGATVALSGYIGPKAFDALQAIGIGTVQDVDNRTVGEVVRAFEAGELTVILPSNKEA